MLTASGYLVARREAIVSSKIQGRLSELNVEEGSEVQGGDILAKLESDDFVAQVARARAQLKQAEAAVGSADAAIQRAKADLAEAHRQLAVNERLSNDKLVPKDTLDAAKSRVNLADASLAQSRADRSRAVASWSQSRADVTFADAQLQNTVIRAPFAGTVVRKMAEVGESVAPIPPGVNISTASGAIVALADLATLEMEADVSEANVAKLIDGQPAEVTVEAFPDRRYKAVLRQVIPTADRTKATVLTKVTLVEKDKDLKPEMSAKVTFLQPPTDPAAATNVPAKPTILVPQSAIVTRDGGPKVFEIVEGRARMRPITTGPSRNDAVVVTDGLAGIGAARLAPRRHLEGRRIGQRQTVGSGRRSGTRCSSSSSRILEFSQGARMAAVEVQNVRKVYKRDSQDIVVLDGLSLEVPEGEFVALMGPSGSGKTTLLNLIAGIDRPTSGKVVVAGTDVGQLSEGALAKWRSRSIGFIFQFYNLIPVLTALENVELPLLLTKLSKSQRRERAMTALKVVGLADRSKHYPRQLSGGQEQRVAIARAIVGDPSVLVADEPTGDLDAKSAEDILNLMQTLNRDFKKTIVMVTHDPRAASRAHVERHLEKGVLAASLERHEAVPVGSHS